MADSALDYVAEITAITIAPNRMQVLYSPADSADTLRKPLYKSIPMTESQYNDSDIQILIQNTGLGVIGTWRADIAAAQANASFNDSDFVGDTYNFRYKPKTSDSSPSYNFLTHYVQSYDSEGNDEIRRKFNVLPLDSEGRASVRNQIGLGRREIAVKLLRDGFLEQVQVKLGANKPIHASWDGTAGASFNWDSHQIASFGVQDVERVDTGTYRVIPTVAFSSANYTISTGVGSQDYAGAPRQLAVISRAVDSFQVHCEQTDDGTDEDNAYMSVIVTSFEGADNNQIAWDNLDVLSFEDSATKEIQSIIGYNDSDMAAWLLN